MDSIPERALRDHHGPSGTYSPQKLFYQVKQAIISTVGPGYLEYTSVLPEVGYQVAQSLSVDPQVERSSVNLSYNPDTQILSVTMPTILHNSHLSWVNQQLIDATVSGFFTLQEDIFPGPPPGSPPQTIDFYRGDLYMGGAVPAGRNANEVWAWQIDTLREIAEQDVRLEGKLPA
ncbi:hypothetical protein FQN51_004627 [Onygenales sp. PD_10]|nr:hypothetical protein FQN51_004627 [Onygenales sp. PD_10]